MSGVLPALVAAVGFALFRVMNARALTQIDVYRATRVLLLTATFALSAITLLIDGPAPWRDAPLRALLFSAAAGMVHFFFGWTLLGTAQQRIGAARTGALVGAVPLFGALVAWGLLGEAVLPLQLVGLMVVVLGVIVIATGGRRGPAQPRLASGVAAALGTAACWSVSPVLIRQGLAGIPSPRAAASVGLLASALLYSALVALARRGEAQVRILTPTLRLLVVGGMLVAGSLWMQWTAFGLAPVATVLVLLQFTPAIVPALARLGAAVAGGPTLARLYVGVVAIVLGSLLVVLR